MQDVNGYILNFLLQAGPFETTKVQLKRLTPGRSYQVQMCATELLGLGKCSDWTSAITVTIPREKL